MSNLDATEQHHLNAAIADIAGGISRKSWMEVMQQPPGPNSWEDVEPSDFGPQQDFDLENHGSLWVFQPVSKAALQWCYAHLPEDCPRWGTGFVIEPRYVDGVVDGARGDGLMSEDDYIEAMEEQNQLQFAQEYDHE